MLEIVGDYKETECEQKSNLIQEYLGGYDTKLISIGAPFNGIKFDIVFFTTSLIHKFLMCFSKLIKKNFRVLA